MGGVIGTLLYLFCRSGCQASVVASALAFHPPSPLYTLAYDEETKQYKVEFAEGPVNLGAVNMKAEMIEVKRGLKVPVIVITRPHAKYTILYSHGNATDCGAMFPMYCMMAAFLQVNVVGYDYTGYGASMSQGIPATEKQTYKDITAVYNYCVSTKLVTDPATELVLYGQSVGSGPSCYLAVCKPIAGLVLHSPIMSGLRVITDSRMLSCFDIFPNITRIRGINAPVFIIHGKDDLEVTFKHGAGLLAAAPEHLRYEPWWVPQRGHNNVLEHNETEFVRRMSAFLEHLTMFHKDRIAAAAAADPNKKTKGQTKKAGSKGAYKTVVAGGSTEPSSAPTSST